jgi:hypothetical protein
LNQLPAVHFQIAKEAHDAMEKKLVLDEPNLGANG